jgi:uncharacterized membrane protein (UPF0136 family)
MTPRAKRIRYALGALLAFGAVNAFAGGYYGLSGAPGVPLEWLEGSPFSDYTIPSLILGVVVGGTLGFAALAVLAGRRFAGRSAFVAGAIVLGWIVVQVSIIGYVSWMQPATLVAGLAILALAGRLMRESWHEAGRIVTARGSARKQTPVRHTCGRRRRDITGRSPDRPTGSGARHRSRVRGRRRGAL